MAELDSLQCVVFDAAQSSLETGNLLSDCISLIPILNPQEFLSRLIIDESSLEPLTSKHEQFFIRDDHKITDEKDEYCEESAEFQLIDEMRAAKPIGYIASARLDNKK